MWVDALPAGGEGWTRAKLHQALPWVMQSCKEISVLQRWIGALQGNEEAMRYLGIMQIFPGFKQAPALHSGHVLHVSSGNLQLNLCSVTFSITLLLQRLLLFFQTPSWPVFKVSPAINLGWHTENSDISTFTRGATTWIDEDLGLDFPYERKCQQNTRKSPHFTHLMNPPCLCTCRYSLLHGMHLLREKRWTLKLN